MRPHNHPFPENSLVGNCIKLAQTTFFDAMPARADVLVPKAPATLSPVRSEPLGRQLPGGSTTSRTGCTGCG